MFAHEFGHDLGLPDLYDTSGNIGGAENSTGFWTLYLQRFVRLDRQPADGIGSKPIDMSALEKIQLGWSNYALVDYRQKASIKLGPAEANTKQAQQLVVLLPDKNVDFNVGSPQAGTYFWHSGSGNNLDSSMTRSFALPAGSTAFSASVNYDTEKDFDYFYLRVSDDNGAHWTQLPTNLSDAARQRRRQRQLGGKLGQLDRHHSFHVRWQDGPRPHRVRDGQRRLEPGPERRRRVGGLNHRRRRDRWHAGRWPAVSSARPA